MRGWEGQHGAQSEAVGVGAVVEEAACGGDAFVEAGESVSAGQGRGLRCGERVLDGDEQGVGLPGHCRADACAGRVFGGVREAFFEYGVGGAGGDGGDRAGFAFVAQFDGDARFHEGRGEGRGFGGVESGLGLGSCAQERHEAVEVCDGGAHGVADLPGLGAPFGVVVADFEGGDLHCGEAEAASDAVVHVAGEAQAFAFDRDLLFAHGAAVPLPEGDDDRSGEQREDAGGEGTGGEGGEEGELGQDDGDGREQTFHTARVRIGSAGWRFTFVARGSDLRRLFAGCPLFYGCSVIEVSNLTKRYRGGTAVDDLSFTVEPGRVTGFLGPNGAGKSTTIRLILGLDRPTSGRATVNGRPYASLDRPLTAVGALMDAGDLHPTRSVREHLRWLARSNGIGERRIGEVLEATGMAGAARKRAKTLSLGMKQRLGVAAALLGDPEVLMLDEPVNGLDPEGVVWIRHLMKDLAAEGRTVLVSSHLMSEMALTAEHLVVIGRGRLLADTSTKDFIAAHAAADGSGASLEEAFMRLTGASVEFRSGSGMSGGAQ